jgi:hypothetical protein
VVTVQRRDGERKSVVILELVDEGGDLALASFSDPATWTRDLDDASGKPTWLVRI